MKPIIQIISRSNIRGFAFITRCNLELFLLSFAFQEYPMSAIISLATLPWNRHWTVFPPSIIFDDTGKIRGRISGEVGWFWLRDGLLRVPTIFPLFLIVFPFRGRFRPRRKRYKALVSATSSFLPLFPFILSSLITIPLMLLEHTRQSIDPEYIE